MNSNQTRNVVAILQRDPLYYRNFGIWWWHIKRELKRNGVGRDELSNLGEYHDPTADDYYEGMSTLELDNEAFAYQYAHTYAKYNGSSTYTPDGDVYLIHDQDVE